MSAQFVHAYESHRPTSGRAHRGTPLASRRVVQTLADISHDVKNILNPLALQLEILRRRVDRGDREAALMSIAEMRQVISAGVELAERLRVTGR